MRPLNNELKFDEFEQEAGMPASMPIGAALEARLRAESRLAALTAQVLDLNSSPIRAERGGVSTVQAHIGVLTETLSPLTDFTQSSTVGGVEAYLRQQPEP
jgi:hypothetical protein